MSSQETELPPDLLTASTVDRIRLIQACLMKLRSFQPQFGETSQAQKNMSEMRGQIDTKHQHVIENFGPLIREVLTSNRRQSRQAAQRPRPQAQ